MNSNYVYSIKTISTIPEYYSIRHAKMSKVVYFRKYADAQKVASFLSLNTHRSKNLYEYEHPYNIYIYHDYYHIEKQEKQLFNVSLALNNIGFHECEIVNDLICCMDTGIFDIQSELMNQYFNEKLKKIMEV